MNPTQNYIRLEYNDKIDIWLELSDQKTLDVYSTLNRCF